MAKHSGETYATGIIKCKCWELIRLIMLSRNNSTNKHLDGNCYISMCFTHIPLILITTLIK